MRFLQENWGGAWSDFFESQRETLEKIDRKLAERAKKEAVFPPKESVFRAFFETDPQEICAVILGQDPYHGEGEATGLSFSVPPDVKLPPTLKNIFKELANDLQTADGAPPLPAQNGDLTAWARQNVLLLNSVLTVAKDSPASHKNIGWQKFTDAAISYLSATGAPKAFVLWGNFAQSKARLIDESRHLIIASAHPSPLSANKGFFGSRPFSRINAFLREKGRETVDWRELPPILQIVRRKPRMLGYSR